MEKSISIKPIINKRNGQINFSLPKRKISKSLLKNIKDIKNIQLRIEGWELL